MGALQQDTAIVRDGERLTAQLSRDWNIWGPNGGYVSAIALRAAGAVVPPDHRPATLSVQYVSPGAFEAADCQVVVVKRGRNAWLLNVALVQNGRTFLQAQVWTTNKAEGPTALEAVMPQVAPPAELKTVAEHLGDNAHQLDGFWRNLDCKPLVWIPWGEPRPPGAVLQEWHRFVGYQGDENDPFLDACRPLILTDTLIWPTHHRGLKDRPDYVAPSLDLTVWFHDRGGASDWLFVDCVADVAASGLIHGRARVWSEDGRLLATGGSNLMHVARS
ncbi:acyl-CoA thioesterase II [Caulobacter ginsengisoli]|uniref:Acyl-CoA thioesterase II n=1 Tax=Caulobacter ginsengisoli TaxID=400775 RepID=A0ABU0IUA8_9CAUL|nr:thioesterase family protein [Caulobacter ginsengisoli]MDQ0465595.1 acyl-CoA thioesterase II [Caulobacter ginsengisoli]